MTSGPALGYADPAYAASLAEFGAPIALRRSGGWLLRRPIGSTGLFDAMGCYPLFACRDWAALGEDLAELEGELVAVSLVADPFGAHTPELLAGAFPDTCYAFKQHFAADLRKPLPSTVSEHHQRYARRAMRDADVEVSHTPHDWLDDWDRLYGHLRARHSIEGIASFSRPSFAAQLRVEGLSACRAVVDGRTVGMSLWLRGESAAYYHLAAYDDVGYARRVSFALVWTALAHLAGEGVAWVGFGAGAGVVGDEQDGLTRFKRGWADHTRPAYLCGRVLDRKAYAALHPGGGERFFPAYRAPKASPVGAQP